MGAICPLFKVAPVHAEHGPSRSLCCDASMMHPNSTYPKMRVAEALSPCICTVGMHDDALN
jgi:hypothetical protein